MLDKNLVYPLVIEQKRWYLKVSSLFPMLFAVYAGRLSDRVGFRLPLVAGMIGTSIALLLPYMFKDQLLVLIVSQSPFGL